MLGCIFKIDQLEFSKSGQCWIADLSLCSKDNYELKDLMKQTKSDIGDDITSLGCLLNRRGDHEQAMNYYLQLLSEPSTEQLDRARCYYGLGAAATALGQYDQALEYHFKELEIHEKRSNRRNTALTHMVMGQIYWKKGDLDTALAYEEKAYPILRLFADPQLSNVHLTMGNIYRGKNEPKLAIQHYETALELNRQQRLPADHENFGIIYTNMGLAYSRNQKPKKALEYCLKAKEILLKSLPPTNSRISEIEGYIRCIREQIEQNTKS
ncbi:unnamed protein product [Adineta steineri]|uniref:Tetratricopeptide repeat protein n=1 Tax=Adineta steineri TaxID=433720 RepID=A0A814MGS6_9BILA|nr:unnamed protein product [Adineta steineri]CAF1079134.1 unnamed protein product [Adineta steineri]